MDKELGWVEGRWSKLDFSHKKVRGRRRGRGVGEQEKEEEKMGKKEIQVVK